MRQGSLISASAGTAQAGGNGGNITINAPNGFIVGVREENSDITADAFSGSGGRVTITAQGIYGLQFRPQLTDFSDITVSSTFGISGVVSINTLDVDPSRGLEQLPANLGDLSGQIVQTCVPRGSQRASSFIITGRGGIAPSPTDALWDETALAEWVRVGEGGEGGQGGQGRQGGQGDRGGRGGTEIIEAQGIARGADGAIYLVAESADGMPQTPLMVPIACP